MKPGGKAKLRLLRLLAGGPGELHPAAQEGRLLVETEGKGVAAFLRETVAALARDGLIRRDGAKIALSHEGEAALRRAEGGADGFQAQHRDLAEIRISSDEGLRVATVNHAESPLAQLARRKAADGRPFLSAREFEAGERLRSDYERGHIMRRLGANWDAAVASGRRDGGAAELTDAAIAARQRVEKALAAVGPELSGVLVDICCFLKGLEIVEAERRWPARSAKVVLKAALAALSRHYDPGATRSQRHAILHWGAPDYRPSLTG